jgi:prephenate dehydrogenase
MKRKSTAIVGTGLIGGSLAIRLHEMKLSNRLIGVESNPIHAQEAVKMELIDEILPLDQAIDQSEVVILAIPVNALVDLLPRVLDRVKNQIVLDLGSTKSALVESVANHPHRGRYVASHPMWGTEFSGPTAAIKNAFEGKAVILCDSDHSDSDALEWVRHMYEKIGMRILEMNAIDHDLHAAYVSHISHITSFALANTVLEKEKEERAIFEMASAGFESTVRLAKSNPDTWVPILIQNRNQIMDVLNEHIQQLKQFRQVLSNSDTEGLQKLIRSANSIRRVLESGQ